VWASNEPRRQAPETPATDDGLVEAVEADVHPADVLVTIFTSGTTRDPKGVVLTHNSQIRHAANLARQRGFAGSDRIFAGMPFFWVGGLTLTFLAALHAGSALICQERFEPAGALELIEREGATRIILWPLGLKRLLAHQDHASRCAEAEKVELPALESANRPPYNIIGMTETSGPYTGAPPGEVAAVALETFRGSSGPLLPCVDVRIVDTEASRPVADGEVGEICVRGYNVMQQLYKLEREATFDADGWYHTGDLGIMRDRHIFFVGRLSEMIKTSGYNVAPREVEVALESLADVNAAFVFGLPDDERGEVVVAGVVVTRSSPDPGAIREAVRGELSHYKVPREVIILDQHEVATLATLKADRKAIREIVAGRFTGAR
jgi:acyl-CoA synthetase (AMP-forming)/AMP-acid ligase II